MFSGIVETTTLILRSTPGTAILTVHVARPDNFDDIKTGDSIAVDGCCLTVETFNASEMTFALGPETLKVTGWDADNLVGRRVNVERSLRLSDRIHGHLVTGHVDGVAEVVRADREGETLQLRIALPSHLRPYIWPKGSVAIRGVSLTINQVDDASFTLGLIPETLKRTNLGELKVGARVNLEIDNMARGLVRLASLGETEGP